MAYLVRQFFSIYKFLTEEAIDPRSKDLYIAAKPIQVLSILALYQLFVLRWGPKLMKNRQPFNVDKIIMAFDIFQVICCGYLFYAGMSVWIMKYKLVCEPIDYSNSQHALKVVRLVYYYFLLKVSDLLDTVFFVLRKKSNHISFLHVFHHTLMVLASWVAVSYIPGGHASLVGIINCFVHVIMYFYYFITLAVPEFKKYIWTKKIVTQVQIIQFLFNIIHMGSLLFVPNCSYPKWTSFIFLPNNLFMLVLFLDFYVKTYVKKPQLNEFNDCNIKEKETIIEKNEALDKGKENLVKRFVS